MEDCVSGPIYISDTLFLLLVMGVFHCEWGEGEGVSECVCVSASLRKCLKSLCVCVCEGEGRCLKERVR